MKTSNKLLLFGIGFVLLSFIGINLFLSKHIIVSDDANYHGEGVVGEKVLSPSFDSDTLYIYNKFEYYLDPNSSQISVQADEKILELLSIKKYRGVYPFMEKTNSISYSVPIKFTIGVKGIDNLTIISKSSPVIKTLEAINLKTLDIESQSRSKFVLEVTCPKLNISAKGKSFVDIKGDVTSGSFNVTDNATVDMIKTGLDSINISLNADALLRVKHANFINGVVEDEARIRTVDAIDLNAIQFFDDGKHDIESWD